MQEYTVTTILKKRMHTFIHFFLKGSLQSCVHVQHKVDINYSVCGHVYTKTYLPFILNSNLTGCLYFYLPIIDPHSFMAFGLSYHTRRQEGSGTRRVLAAEADVDATRCPCMCHVGAGSLKTEVQVRVSLCHQEEQSWCTHLLALSKPTLFSFHWLFHS